MQGPRFKVIPSSHGQDGLYDLLQDHLESENLFLEEARYDGMEGDQIRSKALAAFQETWNEGKFF